MCLQSALPRARRLRAAAWADLPSRRSAWWQSDPLNPKPNATPQRTPRPPHAAADRPRCHETSRAPHGHGHRTSHDIHESITSHPAKPPAASQCASAAAAHAPTIESNPMRHSSLRMSHRKDGCPFAAMKSGNLNSRRNWRSCVKGIPYVVVLHPHRAKTVSPSMGPPSGITRLKSQ